MKKKSVICYSNETKKDLLNLCSGHIDGARINSCHPYCFRRCNAEKKCLHYFSFGDVLINKSLAKLLKKRIRSIENMNYETKDKWIEHFEKLGFKKCRAIKVTVEEK